MNARTRLLLGIGLPVVLVVVVIVAFVWRGYATSASPATSSATHQPLTSMTLALDWTPNTNHTGIYVALAKGWYRQQGIDLHILPYSSSVAPETLVSNGKADVCISATESEVSDAATGQPMVSIAAIIQHNTSELITLASSGLNRPRDLNGKIYGGGGAAYEPAVVGAIIRHDGGKGTFKNVTLSTDAMQALKDHRIDFVWIYQGWEGIQAQREGMQLNIFPITQHGIADYYTPTIATSPKEIKQKSDLLRRFMAATSQGYAYARTHAHEAAQMLIDGTPKGTFPDPGLVFASQNYLSPRYVDLGRKWGLQDAQAWHGYPQFMLDSGGITDASGKPVKSLNLDALYTNQFLPR
ncbi:MAG TPA: ABC transporter substrate-binding protein [Ktedonobacteraceae bacterium]|nr:ABC transporter substrate-binding protein [Ktedonobacteraceae bacterium]